MDIAFKCPLCEEEFRVEAALAGTEFRCPTCLKVSLLPDAPEEAESPSDQSASETPAPPSAPSAVATSAPPPPPPVPQLAVRTGGSDTDDARLARRLMEAYQRVTAEVGKLASTFVA